jgi:hypothetical protein
MGSLYASAADEGAEENVRNSFWGKNPPPQYGERTKTNIEHFRRHDAFPFLWESSRVELSIVTTKGYAGFARHNDAQEFPCPGRGSILLKNKTGLNRVVH